MPKVWQEGRSRTESFTERKFNVSDFDRGHFKPLDSARETYTRSSDEHLHLQKVDA